MASVRSSSLRAYEFACHSAACAPPPAGTGGSSGGGRSGRPVGPAARQQPGSGRSGAPVRPNPLGPGAGRNPNQDMINATIRKAEGKSPVPSRSGDGAYYPRGGGDSAKMTSSPSKRNGDGAYYAPTKSKTNDSQIQASDLKKGDRVVFAQQAKTVSSVGMQKNGKVGISFTTGGVTDLRPDQILPRAAAARSPKVSVNQSGKAGKFVAAKSPDKKWAMNPNNPRNHQRHPDSDRASKKIIRP